MEGGKNQARGNTSNPRGRKWIFVINNYSEEVKEKVLEYCKHKTHWIIGFEIGKENNTPHLQGYIHNKNPLDFNNLKNNLIGAHIEKAKGNDDENYRYCSKDGDFLTNMKAPLLDRLMEKYKNVVWKDWQQEVLNILETKPDDRKIYCYIDHKGNSGKSFLCKYIDIKYNAIIAEGKKDDIFHQVAVALEGNLETTVVLIDVPRSQLGYINYAAIEKVKNGHFYSGKYEGKKCIFEIPHVIMFMNAEPNTLEMSMDRWILKKID